MNDIVSVIVPTFNRAYCLVRTINSALAQTHAHLEILVIDDGSTDNTRQLLADRYANEPRVRYHYQPNAGVAFARNQGLALAKGDFIALLDSDDVWFPWKLELQIACMKQYPDIGMVWSDMVAIGPDGATLSPTYLRKMYHAWRHFPADKLFDRHAPIADIARLAGGLLPACMASGNLSGGAKFHAGTVFPQILMGSLVHTSTVLIRRNRADLVKAFDIRFVPIGEDYDFHLRTCKHGPVGFIDLPTLDYQTGLPDQLTRHELQLTTTIHCLKTIAPYFDAPNHVDLPEEMIRLRFAEVHGNIGYGLFCLGKFSEAREHLRAALRHKPASLRNWKLLFYASLPVGLVRFLKSYLNRRREKSHNSHSPRDQKPTLNTVE